MTGPEPAEAGATAPGPTDAGPSDPPVRRHRGRKLITRYNCQGCHLIEGQGYAIKSLFTGVNHPIEAPVKAGISRTDILRYTP